LEVIDNKGLTRHTEPCKLGQSRGVPESLLGSNFIQEGTTNAKRNIRT